MVCGAIFSTEHLDRLNYAGVKVDRTSNASEFYYCELQKADDSSEGFQLENWNKCLISE